MRGMLSVEATARLIRTLYFLIVVVVTVCGTAAGYDRAWGAVAFFAVVDLFLIAPVVIDGDLWNRGSPR